MTIQIRLSRIGTDQVGVRVVNLDREHPIECFVVFSDLMLAGNKPIGKDFKIQPMSFGPQMFVNMEIIPEYGLGST